MVEYTEYKIINDMMNETNNLYNDCLKDDLKVPSIFKFFKDECHMRYLINRQLLMGNCSPVYIKYLKNLINSYPEGFGDYYLEYLKNHTINLTDIYYDLIKISYKNIYV